MISPCMRYKHNEKSNRPNSVQGRNVKFGCCHDNYFLRIFFDKSILTPIVFVCPGPLTLIFLDAFPGNSVILSVALQSVVPRQQGCNNRNLDNKVNFWQNSPKIASK